MRDPSLLFASSVLSKPLRPPPAPRAKTQLQVVRFAWLFALNFYLVSPVLLYELGLSAAREGGPDKIVLFALPASMLWLLTIQLCRRPWVVHLAMLPFYGLVTFDLYLISHYKTRLTSSTITLVLENWGNAGDYWSTHGGELVVAASAAVAFWVTGLLGIRKLELPVTGRSRLVAAAALIGLYGLVVFRQSQVADLKTGLVDMVSHDRNSPFGVIPQAYVAYEIYRDVLEHQEAAGEFRFGATRAFTPGEPELFVLVIGESARRDHWQLYGYDRPTTPRLAGQPNLVAFTDVVSQAALTQLSVPLILTRGTIDDRGERVGERSIVSAFEEVGFRTHWYSTQQRDQYTGPINRYSGEAHVARFLDRHHDGALVDLVARSLEANTGASDKMLFVLHTQGSHGQYADRYPDDFRIFPTGRGVRARDDLINAYDNSVAYTDFVLAELIALMESWPGLAAMLYVPDHGENLEDDERGLLGHFFNNEYDLPIPMVFWHSDTYAQRYPEKVAAARANANARISTRAIFYTLADLANVVIADPNMSALSVLSPSWVGAPRHVLERWDSVHEHVSTDFDQKQQRLQHDVSRLPIR